MGILSVLFILLGISAFCSDAKPPESRKSAIIGGETATIEDVPYAAAVLYLEVFACCGTVIGEKFVLTAAHCVSGRNSTGQLTVRVGSSYADKGGILHQVKRAIPHPFFWSVEYDVAVIELEKKIEINKYVKPIPVTNEEPKTGEIARVSGWGMNDTGTFPDQLQTMQVPVVTREKCQEKYSFRVTPRMICTHGMNKSPLLGDSGAPMVVNNKVAGSLSFGQSFSQKGFPTGYANLGNQEIRDFIKELTGI